MKLKSLNQLFSFRDLRNALLGLIVIAGGLGLSGLTLLAHWNGRPRAAAVGAAISLIFVLLILIFVVPPLARNASKEASQLNLPFDFTLGGAIVLGLLLIVGFSAWNTGNNLLFLVLSFLTAALVVGFFAGALMLKKLDVKMRFPETIFAGEETPILVSLHNRKRFFPSYSIVAEVRGKEREESIAANELRSLLPNFIAKRFTIAPVIRRTLEYFVYVPRNELIENRTLHVFPERGRFLIKDFELSTKFPFAFFRHRRRLAAKETELIVFPRLLKLQNGVETPTIDAGKLVAFKKGSGQDLLALRDYQPNDDLRRVDWKATARSRHLIVREFAAEDDRRVTIFVDDLFPPDEQQMTLREKLEAERDGRSPMRSEKFERLISTAAAILNEITEERAELKLIIGGDAGEFGTGIRHLHSSLRRLALAESRPINEERHRFGVAELLGAADDDERSSIIVLSPAKNAAIPDDVAGRTQVISF